MTTVESTASLVAKLRANHDAASVEAAALLEWLVDERATLIETLKQERTAYNGIEQDCEEMCARLFRLQDHLHSLANFAGSVGHEDRGGPPDPFPDKKTKRRTRA